MRRALLLLLLLSATAVADATAQSIPNCGSISTGKDMWQDGYNRYVFAYRETYSQLVGCPLILQTEAWVQGVGGAETSTTYGKAWVKIGRGVPSLGKWESFGKHWVINLGIWTDWGETHAEVTVVSPPNGGGQGGGGGGDCDIEDDDTTRAGNGCDSPIILDTAGDGYRLTSVRRGVFFDLDADGTAERVAWTRADSDDAFLALDRNGNGTIDNGAELFGNATPAHRASATPTAANGFEALKFAEGPSYVSLGPSLVDGRIDARDAIFSHLLLWTDRNHNGLSEPDELLRVADSNLVALSTSYRESRRRDRFGNEFRLRSLSDWADGSRRPAFDVWLRTRDVAPETDDDPQP